MPMWLLESAPWASEVMNESELPVCLPPSEMEWVDCIVLSFVQVPLVMTGLKIYGLLYVCVSVSPQFPTNSMIEKNGQTADGTVCSPEIYSFLLFLSIT